METMKPIRWGRVVLGAILLEIVLSIVAVPAYYLSDDPNAVLSLITPPACLIVAFPIGMWVGKASGRPVLAGALIGVVSLVVYGVLLALASQFAPPEQRDLSGVFAPAYLASHLLKIIGGAAGGWWVSRQRTTAA